MSLLTAFLISGTPVTDTAPVGPQIAANLAASDGLRYEGQVSAGYQDVSTPENWDKFWSTTLIDFKTFRNNLIATYTPASFWDTATDEAKKALVRRFVYPSTETTANLDLLYTQAERDAYQATTMEFLNVTVGVNVRKSITSGSIKYFDVALADDEVLDSQEIKPDVAVN